MSDTQREIVGTDFGLVYTSGKGSFPCRTVANVVLVHAENHAFLAHCITCGWFGPERLFQNVAATDGGTHLGGAHG